MTRTFVSRNFRDGLVGWYNETSLVYDGGNAVSRWTDISGKENHLIQDTAASQPTRIPAGQAGKDVVEFDGTADYLRGSFTLDQPTTVYVVAYQTTWTASDRISSGGVVNSLDIIQSGSSPNVIFAASAGLFSGPISFPLQTWGVLTGVSNGANGRFSLNNNAALTGDYGAANAQGLTAGAAGNGNVQFNGRIAEIMLFRIAHTASQRALVISQLMSKWGVV